MIRLSILGSTGSIGSQALEICRLHPDRFQVVALTARSSREKLFAQVREFQPEVAGLLDGIDPGEIPQDLRFCRFLSGREALRAAAAEVPADQVLVSIVGIAGLQSVMDALGAGRQVLLANKEALVTGGHLVTELAKKMGKPLLPVDSEHSAIFQCLQAAGKDLALKHPNWSMGAKITIDSATMMNKGLEIIEASWLFDVPASKIDVHVHPESILHSAVEFMDGSVLGQMGNPDMRVPIAYALSWPKRLELTEDNVMEGAAVRPLDLFSVGSLHFEKPDPEAFPCLAQAYRAIEAGKSYPIVLNAANEEAVAAFLADRIRFYEIAELVEKAMDAHRPGEIRCVEDIFEVEREAREIVSGAIR